MSILPIKKPFSRARYLLNLLPCNSIVESYGGYNPCGAGQSGVTQLGSLNSDGGTYVSYLNRIYAW